MKPAKVFSLLQFNMQYGQPWLGEGGGEPPVDLEQTIAFLREQDTDVILLQEIEHASGGTNQIEPPPNFTRIQNALDSYQGYFSYPEPDPDELPFGIGQAILSRFPLSAMSRKVLPAPDVYFSFKGKRQRPAPRLLIGARTTINGQALEIFNVHLQAFFMIGASSDEYPAQGEEVIDEVARVKVPALIGGDFNCAPGERLVEKFSQAGLQPCQREAVTWKRRPYVLDHVFHNGGLRCLSHEVVETDVSDHHALRVELAFA